jgi:hypothetical protein
LAIIHQFELGRRKVTQGFEQTTIAEPVCPVECGVLAGVEMMPRTTAMNDLGFVESDDRLAIASS